MAEQSAITFLMGDEEYAVDLHEVREIRPWQKPTRIATTPDFILGVINLRGAIVPIVDLRIRFHICEPSYTPTTVMVILDVRGKAVGVVVDEVKDVLALPEEGITPAPKLGVTLDSKFIKGLASLGERTIIVLDAQALLTSEELMLTEKEEI